MRTRAILWSTLLAVALGLVLITSSDLAPSLAQKKVAEEEAEKPKDQEAEANEIFEDALEALLFGRQRSVKRSVRKLAKIPSHANEANWLKAQLELRYGEPAKASKLLSKEKAIESTDPRILDAYCEALYQAGQYALYDRASAAFLKAHASSARANFQRGRFLSTSGNDLAKRYFELADAVSTKLASEAKGTSAQYFLAEEYYASGLAANELNNPHSANNAWYDALEAYEYHEYAIVAIGRNFLDASEMDRTALANYADRVLAFNSKSVPALLLTASAHGFRGRGLEQRTALNRAVLANRSSHAARLARANYAIGNANYEAAKKDLEKAQSINSKSLEYLAAQGYYAIATGDKNRYTEIEAEVLKATKKPGEFYLHVGNGLQRRFRPRDAIEIYKIGMEKAPKLVPLHRGMGYALLSLGANEIAIPHLQYALKHDVMRNKIDTQNILILFEEYYEDLKEVEICDGRIVMNIIKKDQALLIPYYEKAFNEGLATLSKKYGGYQLRKPLYVDVFPDADTFSVRTMGLKGIPASGVCFGEMINLAGPLALGGQGYNWASTLIHELDHAYQLQMSNGQIPRWLAEGSSVYQERLSRPEWERHLEEELFQVYSSGVLPSVRTFDEWFGDGSKVMFAYYLGGVMVDFINQELGNFEVLTTMIKEFGAYLPLEEVFQRNLKISTNEFDERFRGFVEKKLSAYKIFPAVYLDDPRDLIELAEDGEATIDDLAKLSRWYFQRDRGSPDARKWAGLAEKMGGESRELYYVLGMLTKYDTSKRLSNSKRLEKAKDYLAKAINMGVEDYYLYLEMAEIAQGQRDVDTGIFFLNRARRAFPTSPQPIQRLIGVYGTQRNDLKVQELAEDLVMLDENNTQHRSWLLKRYEEIGDFEKAADMAEQLINVNPYLVDPHLIRGKMLREIDEGDAAIFEFLRAYDAASLHEAPGAQKLGKESALGEIAESYLLAGNVAKLGDAMARLTREFPESEVLNKLKKRLENEDKEVEFP